MSSHSRRTPRLPELPAGADQLSLIENAALYQLWPYKLHEWDRILGSLPVLANDTDLEPVLIAARRFIVYQRQNLRRPTLDPETEIRRLDDALCDAERAFQDMSVIARLKVAASAAGYSEIQNLFREIATLRTALPREHEPDGPSSGASHIRLRLYLIREADRVFTLLADKVRGRPAFITAVIEPLVGHMTQKTLQSNLTEARKLFP